MIAGFSDEISLCGMESGRGAVKMGSLRCGLKTIVGMKVPKRWCLRKSKGPGPEQSVIVESGYLENRCGRHMYTVCFRVAGRNEICTISHSWLSILKL